INFNKQFCSPLSGQKQERYNNSQHTNKSDPKERGGTWRWKIEKSPGKSGVAGGTTEAGGNTAEDADCTDDEDSRLWVQ
ncbi:hypothetical protein PIB30_086570, partial [Stylosanthes scabra]|nr:hypothetical protein [Stylosanthes scabra]